jgi:hypothetical protein
MECALLDEGSRTARSSITSTIVTYRSVSLIGEQAPLLSLDGSLWFSLWAFLQGRSTRIEVGSLYPDC